MRWSPESPWQKGTDAFVLDPFVVNPVGVAMLSSWLLVSSEHRRIAIEKASYALRDYGKFAEQHLIPVPR